MIADGYLVGDGSWELHVLVTDLQVERTLRVKGDLHIGGLMLNLVEELGMCVSFYFIPFFSVNRMEPYAKHKFYILVYYHNSHFQ